jgi:subtilisin family serine protease
MPALGVDCFVMQAAGGESLEALAERIARDARVESAQAMSVFRVLAHDDPLYSLQPAATAWHLAEMHRLATGRSVRIAEIDTAVDVANPDLDGQVALARDFVGDRAPSEMHGTAVAGIIAARADNGVGIAGVAPDARLLALRACRQTSADNPAATCTTFALAKALQFALDARADVLNLSVGGPRDRLLERLLDVASARGVTIVAAADPAVRDGGFPAGHLGVLAIGADGAHDLADGLLRAPGIDVPTTLAGNRFGFVSGSSYAAAHVSGLVALLRELAPTLTPRQIRDALQTHALPGNGPASGLIVDACAALERTAGACACACTAREERAALR